MKLIGNKYHQNDVADIDYFFRELRNLKEVKTNIIRFHHFNQNVKYF